MSHLKDRYDILCEYYDKLAPHVYEFIENNSSKCACDYEWHRMARHMLDSLNTIEVLKERLEKHIEEEPEEVSDSCTPNTAPLTRDEAHEWVSYMKATGGAPWTPWTVEQSTKLLAQNNVKLGTLSDWCANALLNMLWSDNPSKTPDQILAMAKEYVADPDTVSASEKLGIYYRYIAKH